MATGKRVADAPPGAPPKHTDKKQKTTPGGQAPSTLLKTSAQKTQNKEKAQKEQHIVPIRPETSRNASTGFAVVPATPGTIVNLDKPKSKKEANKAKSKETQNTKQVNAQPPPTTLPLEPHAAILGELQHKYNVRVLSVISSTRMEKRIKAILEHLGGGDAEAKSPVGSKALPGVVLLHARAPDANKLVSITEIVKRRIREGHFADKAEVAKPAKKKKGKGAHAAAVAWYQYDRIYDVKTARKKLDGGADAETLEDGEEEEAFEPAMHRLEAALTDEASSTTKITTYMSIMLSRTPISELHKNPDISVQCSTDPLEVEYEQFMAEA